jgi:hypothetical protein
MNKKALMMSLLLSFAVAIPVQSQDDHGTTSVVRLRLTEDCDGIKRVYFVRDGEDGTRVRMDPDGVCRWKAELPDGKRYHTNVSRFSLRMPGWGRSPCMKALWQDETGLLTLHCCSGKPAPVYEVVVSSGDLDLVYSRVTQELECVEWGKLEPASEIESRRTIHDIQFGSESVRLKVLPGKTAACGLIVNELPGMVKPARGEEVEVRHETAVNALAKQDARGQNCHAPVLSAPNTEHTSKTLQLKSLRIKVQ